MTTKHKPVKIEYLNRAKENTWRVVAGKDPVRSMPEVVAKLKKYMDTYDKQYGYENWSDDMLIEDVLYGLGAALGDEYEYAVGYKKFKKFLLKHIEASTPGVHDE